MDIQAEKRSLIEWLAGIDDNRIIKQLRALQKSNEEQIDTALTSAEKTAIDHGLKSITDGNVHTHESVMKTTKEKYPNLFK